MNKPGRPRLSQTGKAVNKSVMLTPEDLTYLLTISPNISAAIRILVAKDKER